MPRQSEPGSKLGLWLILAGSALFAAVVILVPPSRGRTLVALLLPMATLLGVSVWWFRSGLPTRRIKAVSVGMAVVAALFLTYGSTFPATIVTVLWGMPVSLGLTLLVFYFFRSQAATRRLLAVGLAFLASLVPWPLLRADGASGQMMPNLFWVWEAPASFVSSESGPPVSNTAAVPIVATPRDWPGFRGGLREGIVPGEVAAELNLEWGAQPPSVIWRRAIGRGWSSFAVVGNLACTQDQAGETERVVCLDARTGRTVWVHSGQTRFEETAGGPGPRANR